MMLATACIVCYILPMKVGLMGYSLSGILLYHFFHANWAHLALNMWGLIAYKPKFKTFLVAYVCASLSGALPFVWATEPTYGLSAFLFACYARTYALYKKGVMKVVGMQIFFGLLPHMNWRIHVASFLMSYLYWRIYYARH